MSDAPYPVQLSAPEGARRMEISWSDGSESAYTHEILRGFCPCAHCQGHHGPVRWVEDAEQQDLSLTLVESVGNYAVRLGWGDGHSTGIYSFRFLRELSTFGEASVESAREQVFGR